MSQKPPAGNEGLVAMLKASAHLMRELELACEAHGVTHDQYNVLRIVRGAHPVGLPRGEISSRLISRAPDVTRMLDRLVARGLAQREWNPDNRRLSIATITKAGLELLAAADRDVAAVHSRFSHAVSRTDLDALRRICTRLIP